MMDELIEAARELTQVIGSFQDTPCPADDSRTR